MAKRPEIQYVQFYVDGSAARKLEPAAPVKESSPRRAPAPRRQKRKNIYIDPVAIFGIAVSVVMLVMMLVGVGQLKAAQAEAEAIDRTVAQLRLDNHSLRQQFDQEIDLSEIEQKALALGMVPASQVPVTTIVLSEPETVQEPVSIWEQVGTFLAALFA